MGPDGTPGAEARRLEESRQRIVNWKRWGAYVAERAWGTVREDYSARGVVWEYFPHDHARSRAYRWNEDGLAGFCDRHQIVCLGLALWNRRDPILKERLFGLNGKEGNHGEDVKECYYYLDGTPTHSYLKFLYKYPQEAYPYAQLVTESARRTRQDPEYELIDTGLFDEDRYFDVFVEYAKVDPEDTLMRVTVWNRGAAAAPIDVLPTVWLRNTWSWAAGSPRPIISRDPDAPGVVAVKTREYGTRWVYADGTPQWLFTENDTNIERLYGVLHEGAFYKDGIGRCIVEGRTDTVNPAGIGTKASSHYALQIPPGRATVLKLRFSDKPPDAMGSGPFGPAYDCLFEQRIDEAGEFYAGIIPSSLSPDAQNVMRQALAGLMWSKQFYHYDVKRWLEGDPTEPPPPPQRLTGRNHEWQTLYNDDVLSMPDTWEYPWYAAWDLAFHAVALAIVDPDFAKQQLVLLLREWYMHPNGQLPAYEWDFSDVNPPLHAWAALRVYRIEQKRRGTADRAFLERVFQKLLLNFTWWVNRKDAEGNNIFEGGFLGLDNIGVFDRSRPIAGGHLEQSDGTSWMAMYSLNLLAIALELASEDPVYEDVASKFWEHFVYIARAMTTVGGEYSLWDDHDGFFYDVLHRDGQRLPLKVRSMVGLIPLLAVETLEPELLNRLQGFKRRLEWFIDNRPDLTCNVASMRAPGRGERRLLSIVNRDQLERVLRVMLDEREFLSPHGIRGLSRYYLDHPYTLRLDGDQHRVDYEPAESVTGLFGGNSNWRGPVWFPVNYLLIEALQRFHYYYGDSFTVECPTGSGHRMTLDEVAAELSRRLTRLFLREPSSGRRPVYGSRPRCQTDPHWKDLLLFYEYFNGDTGEGLGASHQTGWTALVAKLLQQSGE